MSVEKYIELRDKIEECGLEESDSVKCENCGNNIEYFGLIDTICDVYEHHGKEPALEQLDECADTDCGTCYFQYYYTKEQVQPIRKALEEI